jgi:Na+/melibiose symporter-like transporter
MIEQQAITEQQSGSEAKEAASIMDVMKNRHFLKLWMAQLLSQTAQQIVNFALLVQVDRITGSSTAVSGIIIAFTVPAILFAAIAGVFVERNSKKTMLVLTNLGRGIMALAYVFTDERWGAGAVLPIFYVVTFLFATVSQFFNPAEASMIPLVVKRKELVAANSIFNLTLTGTMLGGFVLLGPTLVATVFRENFSGLYLVIFALCIAASALTYFLPQDKPGETAAARRQKGEVVSVGAVAAGATEIAKNGFRAAWDELAEGWHFIRRDSVIMSAILYWSVSIAVFMMLGTIGPGFIKRVLGLDQDNLIYILLPGGIGLIIGVILVGRFSSPNNRESMINWGLFAAGLALVFFAAVEPIVSALYGLANAVPSATLMLGLAGFLTLLLGMFNSFISVPAQTALQERTPENIRARVFSAFYTVSNAAIIVPVIFAATSADRLLGIVPTVASIGIVMTLIAGVGLYRSRSRKGATIRLSSGHVTPEEADAALKVAALTPQPPPTLMHKEAQDIAREIESSEENEKK